MENYKGYGHINLSMATKAEIEEEISSTTGLDLEWSKMTKDDLEHLQVAIKSGDLLETMAKEVAKETGKSLIEQQVEDWTPGERIL